VQKYLHRFNKPFNTQIFSRETLFWWYFVFSMECCR